MWAFVLYQRLWELMGLFTLKTGFLLNCSYQHIHTLCPLTRIFMGNLFSKLPETININIRILWYFFFPLQSSAAAYILSRSFFHLFYLKSPFPRVCLSAVRNKANLYFCLGWNCLSCLPKSSSFGVFSLALSFTSRLTLPLAGSHRAVLPFLRAPCLFSNRPGFFT